jgi:hypothetical protein
MWSGSKVLVSTRTDSESMRVDHCVFVSSYSYGRPGLHSVPGVPGVG